MLRWRHKALCRISTNLTTLQGYEPRYDAPESEPPRFFDTAVSALHLEDSSYIPDTTLPEDFYSSDFYATKLLSYFESRTPEEKKKPFFAYLPFSAPHWPLQAPAESVAKYKDKYKDGPAALRLRRLEQLKSLGLIPENVIPHEVIGTTGTKPCSWDELSTAERAKSARSMEVYAGMVDRMDENIGRVVEHLKESGEYDNTFILFMSDNGAEGASYEAMPLLGEEVVSHINKYYNNSLENIGRKDSFVWYGSLWAQAATAPSRLYKMFSTQGGCRVPFVMKPAKGSSAADLGGKITDAFCTVMDIVPTILELAGLKHPSHYNGREVAPLMGSSWVPYLSSTQNLGASAAELKTTQIHDDLQVTGWEICGSGAIRRGRYKITYVPFPKGPQRWELFDIVADAGETTDISIQHPELFQEMKDLWEIYKKDVGVVGLAEDFKGLAAINENADEFEDSGKWIRYIGKEDVPSTAMGKIPF